MTDDTNAHMTDIAENFSGHRFDLTYDHLADNIRWQNLGDDDLHGKAAVIEACNSSANYLRGVTTTFTRTRTIVGPDVVVIDSQADYLDGTEAATVASCDIYDFAAGKVSAITSYTVEL